MQYRSFKDKKISLLGYGAMRFPTVEKDGKRVVDIPYAERLIDRAIEGGVNYFDTAYPYHRGESERILGKILSKYPRESYFLADKFPGHQIMQEYNVEQIFEEQLEKCGVDYFDFYLLHNVCESSVETYLDPKWSIIDRLLEQKRKGKIRHLGFSTHASVESLADFLRVAGDKMEFCQIQHNYLDDTLQRADEKVKLLRSYGIPIIVMEPVRGGKLANLNPVAEERLRALRPNESPASFCFRWLERIPEVTVILSGMSDMAQLEDNLATLSGGEPLSEQEALELASLAESMKKSVPCTACRYCVDGCPASLDIPELLSVYNDLSYAPSANAAMRVEFLADEKKPEACIGCGKCMEICPQKIEIPKALASLSDMLHGMKSWREICREREEDARRQRKVSRIN